MRLQTFCFIRNGSSFKACSHNSTMAMTGAAAAANLAPDVSKDKFLQNGLELFGYHRWRHYKYGANLARFKQHFGVLPATVAEVWSRLRKSTNHDIRLEKNANPRHLLLACSYLWGYQTEPGYAKDFKMTAKTARKWKWIYVRKIAGMFPALVRAPSYCSFFAGACSC